MRHLFSKGSYTTPALLNAAVAVSRMHGERRAAASSRGGAAAAKTSKAEAASWQAECVTKARALLAQGKSARELGGILAKQLNKSTRQISNVLKKAEVK